MLVARHARRFRRIAPFAPFALSIAFATSLAATLAAILTATLALFPSVLSAATQSGSAGSVIADPDLDPAARLLDRAFRNLYAEDYVQTMTLITQSRGGKEMNRRLQITRRQSQRPGKALLRFLYPQSIRKTSVLILENENASDDLYIYLPAVRLTRHLSSAQRADAFFGTDLSYEDVEPKHVEDFDVRRLPEEDPARAAASLAGRTDKCELLEVKAAPGFESAYERQISCVEPERAIIYWTDYYKKGAVAKRLSIDPKEVRKIGDRYIPFVIEIRTPRERSLTRVVTEEYDLRAEISDRLFNTWNLVAGDAASDRKKTVAMPAAEAPSSEPSHLGE